MNELNEGFAKLEAKVSKAIELFKANQNEKHALAQEIERLKPDARERAKRIDALEREVQNLREEREAIRARLENLLSQIELLTKSDSTG